MVFSGISKSDFKYDGLGRLRQRQEYTWYGYWSLSSTVNYVYDGRRVIQERDGNNTPTVSYTRGIDLAGSLEGAGGIGGLLARSHGYSGGNWSTHNYYHADGGGNITCLMNSSQAMAATYRYDPFGKLLYSSGSLASANVYRFSSKEYHSASSLYYYGFRFYDPNLQRWLNRDPIGEAGGLNLYGFAENDPLSTVDPLGNSAIGKIVVLGCKGIKKVIKIVYDFDELVDAAKAGEDIACKSRRTGFDVARAAGGGKTPIHEIDRKTGSPHFHIADRSGGHIFYGAAGALTFSYYAEGNGSIAEASGFVLDLVNPLSLPQDILDVKDAIFGPQAPAPQTTFNPQLMSSQYLFADPSMTSVNSVSIKMR